ncbi:hypothetical protein AB0M47_23125, partial [Hamadaea sp. NPDC051192]|uniref:hypothetical protein n=1 Tax=Hamadaea sp. NPDC051192 TaxID=3154940 RepID=UPI00343C08DD
VYSGQIKSYQEPRNDVVWPAKTSTRKCGWSTNFLSEAGLQLPEWAQVRQLAADVMSALQVSWDIDADSE